mgnify:FL=1
MMKIAVVGVTGLVGRKILQVLSEKGAENASLIPVASPGSVGKEIIFGGKGYKVIGIEEAVRLKPDVAIFSAGSEVSKKYAPAFAEAGTTVIDNSSAWRMHEEIPLIIPEINGNILTRGHKIIANPNCSTIQMLMVLAPIHRKYGIKRVVVATYQSVTGSGYKGLRQLEDERAGVEGERAYPHNIDLNLIPKAGEFSEDGYTSEEIKLVKETHKILDDHTIRVTATAVRAPVKGGHSEAVNLELENHFELEDIKSLLSETEGVTVQDDPSAELYPMPANADDRDEVLVGRIRRDRTVTNGLNLWIVADNLRKGAATNAVDIALYVINNKLAGGS